MFDVGAHKGAVSLLFRSRFPRVAIHAFEPGPDAFRALSKTLGDGPAVTLNALALSCRSGEGAFLANGARTTNRLIERRPGGHSGVIDVRLERGEDYCARKGVERISFLKIDTEGHDLEVLAGFRGMLMRQSIDFVQVEAGMNPENRRHAAFSVAKSRLESCGYRLFHIYGQSGEKQLPILRRCDAVFVSLELAEAFRRA